MKYSLNDTYISRLSAALSKLQSAVEFLDLCKSDKDSVKVGAMRDAREWVESSAREVVELVTNKRA